MYNWTDEQLHLFKLMEDAVINKDEPTLIKAEAVAGSSKSTSMIEAVKRINKLRPTTTVRYLVFNSANAQEAKLEFGTTAIASTLHSLAHKFTVRPYRLGLVANFLTWQDIPKTVSVPFGHTPTVLNAIEQYCNTTHPDFATFMKAELLEDPQTPWFNPKMLVAANSILDLMATGKMRCTHSFYLKLFHLLVMSNQIKLPETNLLIVDEAQDLTPITLDIFHKFPAKTKVLVGDPAQAIYSFMGCVSAFEFYKNQGETVHLSKSFRVKENIAHAIEYFCQKTFDPQMSFKGMQYDLTVQPKSHAYLTRTNASLIGRMIQCNKDKIPYKLATSAKVKQIFALPLALIYSKPGGKQYTPELQVVQHAVDEWGASKTDLSKLAFVKRELEGIEPIQQAIKLIVQHGSDEIINAAEHAEEHKKSNANYYLMTVHTSKGLTFDEVTLADDVNSAIEDALEELESKQPLSPSAKDELFLYYVAASRCRYKLNNAEHLAIFS